MLDLKRFDKGVAVRLSEEVRLSLDMVSKSVQDARRSGDGRWFRDGTQPRADIFRQTVPK
jgi:hypothetical protein